MNGLGRPPLLNTLIYGIIRYVTELGCRSRFSRIVNQRLLCRRATVQICFQTQIILHHGIQLVATVRLQLPATTCHRLWFHRLALLLALGLCLKSVKIFADLQQEGLDIIHMRRNQLIFLVVGQSRSVSSEYFFLDEVYVLLCDGIIFHQISYAINQLEYL